MAEISAWDIYWVLQLDSLNATVSLIGVAFLAAGVAALIATGFHAGNDDFSCNRGKDDERKATRRRIMKIPAVALPASALLFVATGFLPSTKTAAAMYIIPAVANNETLRQEASELYGLAKEALKEAVGHEEKSK